MNTDMLNPKSPEPDALALQLPETVRVRNRSFITLTGNNPIITGDMAKRTLPIDILPRSADPERNRYGFNPAELMQRPPHGLPSGCIYRDAGVSLGRHAEARVTRCGVVR
jgi:hypothetical protein